MEYREFKGYHIFKDGRVWSPKSNKFLKTCKRGGTGRYLGVQIKQKPMLLHRVVALAWIPEVDGKPDVNHKDGNRQNNHADNLEWCNAKENMQHAARMKLHKTCFSKKGAENPSGWLRDIDIKMIRHLCSSGFKNVDVAYLMGLSVGYVTAIKNGRRRAGSD